MANKKYYWLKLKYDFFEDDTIQYLEEQENGVQYVNFYLKLCLKALKTNGTLIRLVGETLIPYDTKSLAKLTNTDIDTVRVAMEAFKNIGLVKVYDSGEIFLTQLQEMIGSETDAALRKRKSRAKQICDNVTTLSLNCHTEIEKEKELEKEKEIEVLPPPKKEKPTKHKRGEYQKVLLTDDEVNRLYADYGKEKTDKAIKFLDEYIVEKNYVSKSHYLTMRRWVFDAITEKQRNTKKGVYTTETGVETTNPFIAMMRKGTE